MFKNIKAGDRVTLRPVGNAARRSKEPLKDLEVEKVGRKYFYVSLGYGNPIKFDKEDGYERTDYSSDYKAYHTYEDYLESKEADKLWDKLRRSTSLYSKPKNILLDKLREFVDLLEDK